jgi:hypothetical protein
MWTGGRHVRGKGAERDAEEYKAVTLAGLRVLRVILGMIHAAAPWDCFMRYFSTEV